MEIFEQMESVVRGYIRSFPTLFTQARDHRLWNHEGRVFQDFFAGAGALNYGHNNPTLKQHLIDYLNQDGIGHALDMGTAAKAHFLRTFRDRILHPRGMDYKVQFTGPTGTNAVEAALKLARKVTGRQTVVAFTNAFHGMTLGSLALTGNSEKRNGAGVPLDHVLRLPFENHGPFDGLAYLASLLADPSSGVSLPAAVIIETIQAEGGVNVASEAWLQQLQALCRQHDILLLIDDIQVGCGRTGSFFSFESAGIQPDMIMLSKSISGFGLPMALLLIQPQHDIWRPGEHNGTFRGNNWAFVTAAAALETYWADDHFSRAVQAKSETLRTALQGLVDTHPDLLHDVRGKGLILGLRFKEAAHAGQAAAALFERGYVIETAGPHDEVLKFLPPLVIENAVLEAVVRDLDPILHHLKRAAPALV